MSEFNECTNCFEGKSDMDHTCSICGGSGSALLAHAAQRDHIERALDMVQSVELPEPDQVIGHGWDARSYYGADQMRTYGDAREAAGYARAMAQKGGE